MCRTTRLCLLLSKSVKAWELGMGEVWPGLGAEEEPGDVAYVGVVHHVGPGKVDAGDVLGRWIAAAEVGRAL